ncbi:MAG: AAA family ATPase [Acidobacteria bacterium]|nr:AAA family ATPase [Acidobacteriota bacterium]MCG3195378.1 IS481 family transposase ISChy3 [Thermoanaerobaculia bacterium]MCK6682561.1 AAA family ATPase [Thermoanaerobaculia bacterium]
MTDWRSRFGFHTAPFTRELSVAHRFSLPMFDEVLMALFRAVDQRGSAALVAPAGTGKTALLRALLDQLPEARYRVHYVKVTDLSNCDLCREIAVACGAQPAGSYPMLVRRLQERFLSTMSDDGVRPVLLLDEAQGLRPEVFSLVKILTNFEMDSRLVLSVILAGQMSLRDLLRQPAHEAVTRRLVHLASLRTLSRPESHRYLAHRCSIAGATTFPFDTGACDAVFEVACGNLRATDQLAAKALEVAHDAGAAIVDSGHLAIARRLLWP